VKKHVVVDFAVHRQNVAVNSVKQGLRAMLNINDGEPLVGKNRLVITINAAPVRSPVPNFGSHSQGFVSRLGHGLRNVENPHYSAHDFTNLKKLTRSMYFKIHFKKGNFRWGSFLLVIVMHSKKEMQ